MFIKIGIYFSFHVILPFKDSTKGPTNYESILHRSIPVYERTLLHCSISFFQH